MFFLETVTTQGSHHYVVTHVNCQLVLELSRPLGKQAGESRLEPPLLSLDILAGMQQPLGQGNAWTTFPFLAREGAWHWVHLPLTSCGSLQCSGLWVEASPAFSRSMRTASGGTDWEVLSEEVTYRCGWEYSLRVSRLLQCSGCRTAFTPSSLASLGTA